MFGPTIGNQVHAMTKTLKRNARNGRVSHGQKTGKSTYVVSGKKSAKGGQTWHLVTDTGSFRVRTSASSLKVIDEAGDIYADALERLAKR